MRGIDERPVQFFSYVDIEGRVPADHPLRLILDEDGGDHAQDKTPRAQAGRMVLRAHRGCLQSHSHPQNFGGCGMSLSGVEN